MYTDLTVKKLPESEVEIEASIPFEDLKPYRQRALKELKATTNLPGFRPGHVPEKMILERVGEQGLLEKAAGFALEDAYPKILKEKSIDAIGQPAITVTKLAVDNPFTFKIKIAVMPDMKLPNYAGIARKIMAKKEVVDVSEKEVDDVVRDIQKTRLQTEAKEIDASKKKGGKNESEASLEAGTEPESGASIDGTGSSVTSNGELPPLTDEFVKTLGDFKDIADFKTRIKENLLKEKELRAKEKKRLELSENIIKDTRLALPGILVDAELDTMTAQFKDDIAKMGVTLEKYLEHIKKTEADLRKEWVDTATKRAKLQVILKKIAEEEKIAPGQKELDAQVNHIKEHHPDVDLRRARAYVERILTNEKVFEFLENGRQA